MAQIYKPPKRAAKKQPKDLQLLIDSVDFQGQGVCSQHSPVVFVDGALPGETCRVTVTKQKKSVWLARAKKIENASSHRITPVCDHYGKCGGCQTQHINPDSLRSFKRASIAHMLKQGLGLTEINWQADVQSPPVGYRRKCRLAIDARNKKAVLLGFRSKDVKSVVNVQSCPVLAPKLNALLSPMQELVGHMSSPQCLGHIGLLSGDNLIQISLRVVKPLGKQDEKRWIEFANQAQCQLLAEYADGHSRILNDLDAAITIAPEDGIALEVGANDFIQINHQVNQAMVKQAANWLALDKQDRLLDLFCGLGNFSLPLAQICHSVLAVEGVPEMVQRAEQNALKSRIDNCRFVAGDLAQPDNIADFTADNVDKVLLDPARDGAIAVIPQIAALQPSHIVYVSCNPSTFVRDAKELSTYKYRLEKISLMDMFPNTAHSELMALFVPVSE